MTTLKGSLWQELKKAIRGSESDYTQIGIGRAVFLLAVPMVLELVMESTFAVVDIYFVGSLGPSAVAIGRAHRDLSLPALLHRIRPLDGGHRDRGAAHRGKATRRSGGHRGPGDRARLLVAVPFALAGIFFARQLLGLMGADAWAMSQGYRYTQWMLGGNAVIMLLFVINAIFRGAGDPALAMRVLWIANLCNMVLDPVLIRGFGPIPALGIEGASIATNIGRGVGVLTQFYLLFKGGQHIRVARAHLAVRWKCSPGSCGPRWAESGQMIVGMTSWIFVMRLLAEFGSKAVAGATIALRIMMFTMMPAWGMSNAVATLVGQNLGAGKPERAERSVWITGVWTMGFLIAVAVLYNLFADNLVALFTDDATVIAIGAKWLTIVSYSYFVYAWWMVSVQAFNGAGDTMTPTRINIVFFWLLQIPLA